MKIYVKYDDEWLYPDEKALGTAPYDEQPLQLWAPKGGICGIQILADELTCAPNIMAQGAEVMLLKAATVQYNTATDDTTDFGDKPFVYIEHQKVCPSHCTRLAPFEVYDAYIPYEGQELSGNKQAFFVQLDTKTAGNHSCWVEIQSGEDRVRVLVRLQVYDAGLPEKPTFALDNWFSLEAMADRHGVARFSPAHYEKIREYARIMAQMRQTHFMLTPDIALVDGKLDLTRLERVVDIFFEAGLQTLKLGPIGQRKRVYHENLLALAKDGPRVDSKEGQEMLCGFFSGVAALAERKGWQDKIVFHLADEPDEPEEAIPVRMKQYAYLRELVHRYIPDGRVCEAVKTAKFQEYIDILVPLTKTYELDPMPFIQAREKGREVWLYTCCVPIGHYYRRYLDTPLYDYRHLFWSIARNHCTGYLHWGLNQLEEDQHPFLQTNQSHSYGDGKILPAGDSHILYPEGSKIYRSVRMNMCRKGCEDVELLKLLEQKAPALWQELTADCVLFHGNKDGDVLRRRSLQMLEALQ